MKKMCLSLKWLSVVLVTLSAVTVPGADQEKSLRFNLAYSSISASQAIVRVIKDAGIFQRSGLDANLIFIGGGTGVIQALLAGDVPIAIVGGEPSILARLQGAETLILAGPVNIMDFSIISAPEVKRPPGFERKENGCEPLRLLYRFRRSVCA